jgi:hypothetical protein
MTLAQRRRTTDRKMGKSSDWIFFSVMLADSLRCNKCLSYRSDIFFLLGRRLGII